MPQRELGCIIALPLGNLLNKYLAKQPSETNNSFPISRGVLLLSADFDWGVKQPLASPS